MRTCADCMHWQPPATISTNTTRKPAYGTCAMLAVDPRTRQVMPETQIDRDELWRADPFRTAADFNACRGWVPADNRKTKPELTVLKGGAS